MNVYIYMKHSWASRDPWRIPRDSHMDPQGPLENPQRSSVEPLGMPRIALPFSGDSQVSQEITKDPPKDDRLDSPRNLSVPYRLLINGFSKTSVKLPYIFCLNEDMTCSRLLSFQWRVAWSILRNLGPKWAPWAPMGWALMGPPGPSWARAKSSPPGPLSRP